MESNRIDEIFKRKLERHSLPVSENAWSQVQSQLAPKKKKKPIIWMMAASISLLILVTAGIVYNIEYDNASMANELINLKSSQAHLNNDVLPEQPQVKIIDRANEDEVNKTITPSVQAKQSTALFAANEASKDEANEVQPLLKLNNLEAAIALNNEIVKPNISDSFQEKEEKAYGIKVEMYYNQQELAEVKPENSTNIFNKKANQLKSLASEYSLADLRSAKNELFASAFQNTRKELNN